MLGIAFQPSFQFEAFQGYLVIGSEFGYADIVALAQANGTQPAQPVFLSGSRCFVSISYFDPAGEPMVPSSVMWRLDDVLSGYNVVAWTPITLLSFMNQIVIPSPANAFISFSRPSETRRITFAITDSTGAQYLARSFYDLNPDGGLYMTSLGFQGQGAFQSVAYQTGNSPANA